VIFTAITVHLYSQAVQIEEKNIIYDEDDIKLTPDKAAMLS
jgi:hypothetical protein